MSEQPVSQAVRLEVESKEGLKIIAITGCLADDANLQAKEVFLQAIDEKPSRILVDLGGTEYISSSGIGLLVSILRRCRQGGIPMGLFGLRPEIAELFKLTRLNQVFRIFADQESALKA